MLMSDSDRVSAARFTSGRLTAGMVLPGQRLVSIAGEIVTIPDPQDTIHLQFRRFAGCPVCTMHLRATEARLDEIAAAGVREVVLFYSTAQDIQRHVGHLPFTFVADPDKSAYRQFGVHAAPRALLSPRAWWPILRAIGQSTVAIARGRPVPPFNPRGGRLGLPADFLIAQDGHVIASKYGDHVNDQWSADEVLRLARAHQSARGPDHAAEARAAT
jgi:peroxiredoxin